MIEKRVTETQRRAAIGTDPAEPTDRPGVSPAGPGRRRETAWRRLVLVMQIAFALALLYKVGLLFREDEKLLGRPYIEDAFYSLSVARSIAQGTGISVDGVNPTNGVQPLICLVNAPLFALADSNVEALRLTLLVQIVLNVLLALAAGLLVAGLWRNASERTPIFWIVAVAIFCNARYTAHFLNGLETGLTLLLILATLLCYLRITQKGAAGIGRHALLGVLLGLGVLARIDVAFLVAAIVAVLVWRGVSGRGGREHDERSQEEGGGNAGRRSGALKAMVDAGITGSVAVLVSLPWWIYSYATFGSFMPISGQSQQWIHAGVLTPLLASLESLTSAALIGAYTPPGFLPGTNLLFNVAGIVLVLGVLLAIPSARLSVMASVAEWRGRLVLQPLAPAFIYAGVLIIFYTFFFRAWHFQDRYLVVPKLLITIGGVTFLFVLWRRSRGWIRAVPVGAFAVVIFFFAVVNARNFTESLPNAMLVPAHLIGEQLEPDARIGMFQSGTTGFLFPDRVVNLDGKVNAGALRAIQGEGISRYVDSVGFDYVIDWAALAEKAFADPATRAHYEPIDTVRDFVIWKRTAPLP